MDVKQGGEITRTVCLQSIRIELLIYYFLPKILVKLHFYLPYWRTSSYMRIGERAERSLWSIHKTG